MRMYIIAVERRRRQNMNIANINKLEKKLIKIFGEKATFAITTARVSSKGYMTRIGARGLPFEVSAYDKDIEKTQKLALNEFEKQTQVALNDKIRPTQPADRYVDIELTFEDIYRLYMHEEWVEYEDYKVLKEKTTAKICQLDNGLYECVINSPYMNLSAKDTGLTKEDAIRSAIYTAFSFFHPSRIEVGDISIDR